MSRGLRTMLPVLAAALLPVLAVSGSDAQTRDAPKKAPPPIAVQPQEATPPEPPAERVEADVATRSVEVTTGFTGHEILIFGAIDNSQAPEDDERYYDVVVVVEGTPFPLVVRRKSDVAGVWMNTSSVTLASVPSYYAIASTRPIEEIAGPRVLERHSIGFAHIKMTPAAGKSLAMKEYELEQFRQAVVRIKRSQKLYVLEPKDGVTFTGRSLFRSTIPLPANVPVGPLVARTYLFRDGQVVGAHIARVTLQRAGLERLVHNFAFVHPIAYGIIAILIAVLSGLVASTVFRRQTAS